MSTPFSIGTRVLGGGAALLILFLLVGTMLPGTWSTERSVDLDVSPEQAFGWLDAPQAWRRWTTWPDSGVSLVGPERGAGASMTWADREFGSGSFEIVEARAPSLVRYRVVVRGAGDMSTDGTLRLEPLPAGVRVHWREEGDFGWNPLMGFWARAMERVQGTELTKSLARLKELVEAAEDEGAARPE